MRVAINIGHSMTAPGAGNATYAINEYEFNSRLITDILPHLTIASPVIINQTGRYSKLHELVNLANPDFMISLHCNAYNTVAEGCEVLYYWECEVSAKIAEIAAHRLSAALNNINRGIVAVESGQRGGAFLKGCDCPAIICEPFFIDNNKEYANALHMYEALVIAYAQAIDDIALFLEPRTEESTLN